MNDYRTQSDIAHAPEGDLLSTELWWLRFYCILGSINLGLIFICYSCVWWARLAVSSDNTMDKKMQEHSESTLSKILCLLTFVLTFANYSKLLVYSSVLNKYRYWGLWQGSSDVTNVTDVTNSQQIIEHFVPMFIYASSGGDLGTQIKTTCLVTTGNLIRGGFTFVLLVSTRTFLRRVLAVIPCLVFTIFLVFYMGAPVLMFHYTQRFYTATGNLDLSRIEKLMIANLVLAQFPLASVIYPIIMALSPEPDLLDAAKVGRFQLLFAGLKGMLIYGLGVGIFCLYASFEAYKAIYNDQTKDLYPVWNIWKFFGATTALFTLIFVFVIPCCCCSCGLMKFNEVVPRLNAVYPQVLQARIEKGEDVC